MNEQEQQIRIAIVDDHEMFRAGVIATLQPHFDIVGQAADVEGSVAMIAQTKPDVVLLDVHVPGGEGGGGAEILVKSRAATRTRKWLRNCLFPSKPWKRTSAPYYANCSCQTAPNSPAGPPTAASYNRRIFRLISSYSA